MSNVPDGAERSEDGFWWWDGNQWQPVEGEQGGGSSETSYETYAGGGDEQGGYGDGGSPPGGAPEQESCDLGPCPTCGEELSMSSPCVFQKGHDGNHECAHDHAWEQADAYSAPMARRCDAECQYYDENGRRCEKRCILKLVHYPPDHVCNLGHKW
jgi:hypothetical protein